MTPSPPAAGLPSARLALAALAAALALPLGACADLPRLAKNVCGNAAVEAGEDCDTFAPEERSCTAPGEAQACRWSCAPRPDGTVPRCPPGWGCGLDGLCREPSARFVALDSPVAAGAFSAVAGDFDGDRRADVLTRGPTLGSLVDSARGRIHHFGPGAALAATHLLPEPMTAPVVADADRDGIDDLVSGVSVGGLLTWRGTPDRKMLPLPAPFLEASSRDLTLVPLAFPSAETRYLALTPAGRGLLLCELGKEDIPLAVVGPAARYASLSGPAAVGPFVDEDPTACHGFALAFDGDNEVTVYQPCSKDDLGYVKWTDGLAPVRVKVSDPVHGGVRAADLNGDGHLDLLIGVVVLYVVKGSVVERQPLVRVAYGDGWGRFASSPDRLATPDDAASDDYWTLPLPERQPSGEVEVKHFLMTELPLAIGEVSGDARPDFVLPWTLLVSHAPEDPGAVPYYVMEDFPLHGSWTSAAIADLNADGRPDVVAATGDPYVDFFGGTGTSQLVASTLPTSGTVSHLLVGDLDGDVVNDVLFVQPGPATGKDGLFVAFGQAGAQPLPPALVGEIAGVRAAFANGPLPQSVAIVSAAVGDATATVTRLLGSPYRQPFAPSFLTRGLPSEADVPLLVTTRPSGPGLSTRDVLAFSFDLASEFDPAIPVVAAWAARGNGRPVELRPGPAFLEDEWPALVAQADLDGQEGSEIALLTADGVDVWGSAIRPMPGRLRIGRLQADLAAEPPVAAWEESAAVDLAGLGLTPMPSGRLLVADLDGDGANDLVVASGARALEESQQGFVAVLWNGGARGFADAQVTRLEAGARMFATVHDRPEGPPSLVYVTRDAVKRVRSAPNRTLSAPEVLLSGLTEGTGIAAADVDGDGLEDLAVVDDQNLRLLRAAAVKP